MAICSISQEERDSFYQMVYRDLYDAFTAKEPVDVEKYMRDTLDLISKNVTDPLVTEAYAQILPGIISQAAFINNNVTMHLIKNGFNLNYITDKMLEFEDYSKVQAYLGTGEAIENIQEAEVKSSLQQSTSGNLPAGDKLELATSFNYIVDSLFSTTGMQNLVNASTKVGDRVPDPAKQFYYDFIPHITNKAEDNDYGYSLTAIPRGALETLVNSDHIYDKTAYSRADNLMFAVTDESGNILFFDKEYNVTNKNNGRPIYFEARSGRAAAENIGKRVLAPEEIAKRQGISVEKAKEVLDAEIKFMTNLFAYTKQNFNKADKWITVPITGTSLGAMFVDYNVLTPLSKVNFVNQTFKPVVVPERNYEASGQTKTNQVFYINGVNGAIPIISRGMSSDIARKIARLIVRPVMEINELGDKRELTVDEKNKYISEFLYIPQSGITFNYVKGTGPILRVLDEIVNLENQDAAEETVYKHLFEKYYVTDVEVTQKELDAGFLEGKTVVKKTSDKAYLKQLGEDVIVEDPIARKKTKGTGFYKVYRRRLHIKSSVLGDISGLFDNFNISEKNGEWIKEKNEVNYVDFIKDNFYINLPLNKDNQIVGLNGHIKFAPSSEDFEKILNYEKKAAPVKTNKGKKSATTKPTAKKKTTKKTAETTEKVTEEVPATTTDPRIADIEKNKKADLEQLKTIPPSNYIRVKGDPKELLKKFREYLTDVLGWERMIIGFSNGNLTLNYSGTELKIPASINILGGDTAILDINVEDVIEAKYNAELAALESKPATPAAEIKPTAMDIINEIIKNDDLEDDDFKGLSRSNKQARDFMRQYGLRFDIAKLSPDELKAKLEEAKKWFNNSIFKNYFPLENLMDEVNTYDPTAVAKWYQNAIILFEGASYSDLYHEAFHGFTRMFMTEEQRQELYEKTRKRTGNFRTYKGAFRSFSKASDLELEEFLAEEFRAYMLSGGKMEIKDVTQRNIFRRILDFFFELFGVQSYNDMVLNQEALTFADDIYNKLQFGRLTEYSYSEQNLPAEIRQQAMNKGAEALSENYSTPLLTMRNSMEIVDTIDSLVSDFINMRIGITEDGSGDKAYYTTSMLSIPKGRQAALTYAKTKIEEAIIDLDEQIANAANDHIKNKLLNQQDALVWAIDNWDTESDKGIIAYYNKKSRFSDFANAAEKAVLLFEDNSEFKSRDGHDRRGNESSLLDLASESVIYLIKSLHALESDGSKALNKLGFNTLMDFGIAWNRITRILQGANSPQEMYTRLQDSKEDYPFIHELLIKLGNPDTQMTASSQNLWTQFNDAFNKTRVPLVALVIDRTENVTERDEEGKTIATEFEYTAKVGGASVADAKIGRDWNDRFKTVTTKYILRDANGNNFLDVEAIYNDYVGSYSNLNRIKFLQDIGLYFDNKSKIIAALNKMVPNPAKILFDRIEAIKLHNDKALAENKPKNVIIVRKIDDLINPRKKVRQDGEVLTGLRGLYNSLQRIQANYTDDYSDFMVLNAAGDAQYEFMENSTITQQVRALQDAPDFNTLTAQPEMNHLSAERNPFVSNNPDPKRKRLITIHELFDMSKTNGPKRSVKEQMGSNEKITIDINNLAGVSFTINGEPNAGIAAADSDEFTKRLTDFHVSVIHGLPMGTTPADKSTILVYHLSNRKYYVNPREFALGTNGEAAAFNILLGYLEAELDRINRVKALPANAPERMVPVGKSTYGVEGEKFVIFADMINPALQKELMAIPAEYGGRLRDYLDMPESSDLRKRIADDVIKVYFANKVNEFAEKLREAEYIDQTMDEKIQELYAGNDTKAKKLTKNERRNIAIKTHVYNSFIHNVETVLLYHGDPALFNMAKEEFQKRNAGINSGGIIPRTDPAMMRYLNQHVFAPDKASYQTSSWYTGQPTDKTYSDQFRSAVLQDVETKSLYYKAIEEDIRTSIKSSPGYKNGNLSDSDVEKIVQERAKPYREMKEGDAQGWITFDGYKALSIMMGAWSDTQELLYRDVLAKKTIDQAKIKEFFPVLKMQYWGPLATNGLPLTAFHKFSLVPLIPSTIENSDLEKLHNKMVEQKVDYALFGSGSKVSTLTSNGKPDKFYKNPEDAQNRELAFTEDEYAFTPNDIFLKYFKKQLEIAPKYKGKTTFPTQLRKLIESGLMSNGVPTDFKADMPKEVRIAEWVKLDDTTRRGESKNYSLLKRFQDNLKNLMAQKKQELLDEIGWAYDENGKPTGPLDKLFAYIESQLTKREMAEHHLDFVKLNKDGKLKTSLDISLAAAEIEKVLVSIVNKKLVKQKVTGEALVQVSGAGYTNRPFFDANKDSKERLDVLGTNDLPFYRRKDGKTMAMKIKIGIQGEYKKLLDIPEVTDMVIDSIREGKPITHLQALNTLIKDEEWLNKGDNRKLVSLAGVRIPVQGLNSMEFMEVYEFLPEGSNQIVLPAEIVAKSGGDFDIDKLTTLMYTFSKNEDGSLSIKEDFQNNVISDIIDILSSEGNYVDLITPNATDIVLPIAQELASKVRPYDPLQNVFSQRGDVISGTRIFEIEYNIYKHGSNSIGKRTLGQGAVDNTYSVIFNTVGAYLEPTYKVGEEKDAKGKKVDVMRAQEIYLAHNTLLTPNGAAISLSDLYDVDGVNKISDVISQLINGWVDIAKDPWIFDIQGNNFVAPSLLLMVQAGVPIRQAAYFASQPIIRQYINEVKKAKSAYAGPLGIQLDNPNYFRSEARKKLLMNFPAMAQYVDETEEGDLVLKAKKIKEAAVDIAKPLKDRVFNQTYFEDHLSDDIDFESEEQLALLLHFLDIEDMSKVITAVKRTTNLDTQVASTLFETNLREFQANQLREDGRLGKDVVSRILDDSSISSFGVSEFMSDIYKNLFTIRDSKLVNDYLLKSIANGKLSSAVNDTFGDQDQFISTFRNDIVMFMFQNYMRNLDLDSIKYYKSLQVAAKSVKLKPTTSSPVSVLVKTIKLKNGTTSPMMYFDKQKLVEEFQNLQANSGKENINLTNPDLPFEFGNIRSNMFQNVREYGRYVMEREYLRHSIPVAEMLKREDYLKYKSDFVNAKFEEFTEKELEEKAAIFAYENTLRDMALDNTFNQYYILKSPNKSYAQRLLDIKAKYPSLVEKYKVLDFLTADEAKTKERVIKFKSSKLDADRINRFHEELLELSDEFNLIESADMTSFQAREIAKFFSNLPMYTMFTTGFNSKGEYGIGQIMPDVRLTPVLESMLNYMESNDLVTWNLINSYFTKFKAVNSVNNTASRYKVKNYTLDQPLWKASKNPKADLTGAFASVQTFRDNYQSPSYLVEKGEDVKKGVNELLKQRPNYLFVFNGASNPEAKPLETNDSVFALSQEHTNVFGLTSKIGFQDVTSQQMTDATYDLNIQAIENSIQALKKAAKEYSNKIFWNAAGYGQYMIGADINGENVNQNKAKATQTFVYLSKRLYDEFGYKNKNYEVVAPKKFIRVTRNDVLDSIKKCL